MADLALTLIMAVWGSSFAILRSLLGDAAATPLALVSVRMAMAAALLLGFMAATPAGRAQLRGLRGTLLRDGIFVGALLGAGFLLQTEGLQRTTASRSGFLTGTLVVLTPLIEFTLFRKRPARLALIGVLLAFVGMTALSAPWSEASQATAAGDALTLGCALIFAGQIVALGRVAPRHPVLPLLLLQLATTGAVAALAGPLVETQHFSGTPRLWLALLYLALFATLLAFGIQTWAQRTLPPVRVALISSLEPVFAALWAALLIGERLTGRELLGGALIVLGVAVGEAGAAWRARARAHSQSESGFRDVSPAATPQRVRRRPEPPEVERAANGLRVRGHGLYLEPRGRPPLGFLAHARGASSVLPERMVATAATIQLLEAAQPRALRRTAALPATYGQSFALGSLRLTVHPAGLVLGSAQLRCEADGLDLVYAGDIGGTGQRSSSTAEPLEQLRCATLAIRAVYGHPRYVFPPREAVLERLEAFVETSLGEGKTPVLVGAALGVAQEVVRFLGGRRTVRLHPTAFRACEVYARQGASLTGFVRLADEGEVILVPPTVRLGRLEVGPHRICVLSGRAVDGIASADEALPLADHAGFDELVAYARASGARRVLAIDGHAEDLARALRALGIEAAAVREHHQLRLPGL